MGCETLAGMKHDERFKKLLTTPGVLQGFFEAFLPEVAKFIDFDVIDFGDKERITHRLDKRTGDLLIKTRFKETAQSSGAGAGIANEL
jgi:hypothetical protein